MISVRLLATSIALFCTALHSAAQTNPTIPNIVESNTVSNPDGTTTLTVLCVGAAPLSYQWYHGIKGDTINPIAGATSDNLTYTLLYDGSPYWLRVSNAYGDTDAQMVGLNYFSIYLRFFDWSLDGILEDTRPGGRPVLMWNWWKAIFGDPDNPPGWFIVFWRMNGTLVSATNTLPDAEFPWSFEHAADFDGDGQADLLWRNEDNGAHSIWLVNNLNIGASGPVYTPDSNWRILACGDYNGDGKADLLWRNNVDGEVVIFAMNGTTVIDARSVLPRNMGWSPVPVVADLNGDGTDDILWAKDGGSDVAAWLMGPGLTVASGGTVYSYGPFYSLVKDALGDYNGDGKTDLVWRRFSNSETVIWLMNGLTVAAASTVYAGDYSWFLKHAADLNGDGTDDLIWRNGLSGDYAAYLLDGTSTTISVSGAANIYHSTTDWTIAFLTDCDGDGKCDLIWQNGSHIALWLMNGLLVKDATALY